MGVVQKKKNNFLSLLSFFYFILDKITYLSLFAKKNLVEKIF